MGHPSPVVCLIAATAAGLSSYPAAAQFVEPVEVLGTWDGETAFDEFGWRCRILGDVDRDGVADIGIGTPVNATGGENAGKLYVYSGATNRLIRSHVGGPFDHLSLEFGGVGDVDGDGAADYIAGAPDTINFQDLFGTGRAILYSGATGAVLHVFPGETFGDGFGGICGGAGDVDADGVPDIIIGAPTYSVTPLPIGRVYVYSGADFSPIHVITGVGAITLFGLGAAGVGDLDADGHDDFIVGAPNAGREGRGEVSVYSGATGAPFGFSPLVPEATGSNFGIIWIAGPGDVDGDGTPDIYVGDPLDMENGVASGKAYVFSGADGQPIHVLPGSAEGVVFGVGRGAGDVNADGHADLVIAETDNGDGALEAGKVFVISGKDGQVLRTITSDIAGDSFGRSTVAAGDIDGDGAIEFLISSPDHDTNGENSGRVYLIAGHDMSGTPGDVNGDGVVDVEDLVAVLLAWGRCPAGPVTCPADLDGDGAVGAADLSIVIGNWS